MGPITRILCPTDFSDASQRARDLAIQLAEVFGAEVYVIHVVPVLPYATPRPTYHFDVPEYERWLHEDAQQKMEAWVGVIPSHLTVHQIIAHGDAAEQILRAAEEHQVDLIVIATHGNRGWRRLVFGSVAEKIVRLAPCPVLTIRPPEATRAS